MNAAARERTWIRPQFQLGGRRYNSFQICGCTGLVLALIQSAALVRCLHLSEFVLLGMTAVVMVTFLGLVMGTKVVTGEERIVYYHHEIGVTVMLALFLFTTRQPLLPYLDIAMLGIGLFLACGRIGCLMVGCCHGRPFSFSRGVHYGDDHAAAGFPSYLVGVPLFPVQAVESMYVLFIVVLGIALVLRGYPSGTAFALYITAYAIGRFCLEFARGDAARPYLWGFSQAQWISVVLAGAVVACESRHILPAVGWHWVPAVALGVWMILATVWRRRDPSRAFELTQACHVQEISSALQHLRNAPAPSGLALGTKVLHIAETSRGYRISEGQDPAGSDTVKHYSVSKQGRPLSLKTGQALARLIALLEQRTESCQLVRGDNGVLHIVFN